jgi:ElaB/YqjD/DUF883 family membrane-anchored ribosome-binding protein
MFYLLEIIAQVFAAFGALVGFAMLISPAPVTIVLALASAAAAVGAAINYLERYGEPSEDAYPMIYVVAAVYLPVHMFLLVKAAKFLVNTAFPEVEAACDRLKDFVVESAEKMADATGGAICFVATRPLATFLFVYYWHAFPPKLVWYSPLLVVITARVAGRVAHRAVELRVPSKELVVSVVSAAAAGACDAGRAVDRAADAAIYFATQTVPRAAAAAASAAFSKAVSVVKSILEPAERVSLRDAVEKVKECLAAVPSLARSAATSIESQAVTASAAFCRRAKHASHRAASYIQGLPAAVPMAYAMGIVLGVVQLLLFQAVDFLAHMAEHPTADWVHMNATGKVLEVGDHLVKISPSVAAGPQAKVMLCVVSWGYAMLCLYVLRPESFEFDLEDEKDFLMFTVPRRVRSASSAVKSTVSSTYAALVMRVQRCASRALTVATTIRGQVVAGYTKVAAALQSALRSIQRLPTSLTAAASTSYVERIGGLSPRSWVRTLSMPTFVKKLGQLVAAIVVLCLALTYASSPDYVNRCVAAFVFEAAASISSKVMNHVQYSSSQLLELCAAIKVSVVASPHLAYLEIASGATKAASFVSALLQPVSSNAAAVLELVHEAAPRLVAFQAPKELGACVLAALVIVLSNYSHLAVQAAKSIASKASSCASKASAFASRIFAASTKTKARGNRRHGASRFTSLAFAFIVLSLVAAACWGLSSRGPTSVVKSNVDSLVRVIPAEAFDELIRKPVPAAHIVDLSSLQVTGFYHHDNQTHAALIDDGVSSPSVNVELLEDAMYVQGPSLAPVEEYVNMGIQEALSEADHTKANMRDAAGSSPSVNVEHFQGPVQAPIDMAADANRAYEIANADAFSVPPSHDFSSTSEPLVNANAPRGPPLARSTGKAEFDDLDELLMELQSLADLFDRKRRLVIDVARRWYNGEFIFLR